MFEINKKTVRIILSLSQCFFQFKHINVLLKLFVLKPDRTRGGNDTQSDY